MEVRMHDISVQLRCMPHDPVTRFGGHRGTGFAGPLVAPA
jgi:hypothetical protein